MKRILFFILDQYADWEIAYLSSAIHMLGKGQFITETVSLTKEPVNSIGMIHTLPDYSIDTMPEDFDALILIGGLSWRKESAEQVKVLVDHCMTQQKILGGICDASAFLGKSGALNHVKHTSNMLDDLKQWAGEAYTNEAQYILEPAVRDQNIITANGTAPLEFAKEVLLALKVASEKDILEWYEFHKHGLYEAPMPEAAQ